MKMVGHRTESVYRRYTIADEGLLKDSAKRLADLHALEKRIKDVSKTDPKRSGRCLRTTR